MDERSSSSVTSYTVGDSRRDDGSDISFDAPEVLPDVYNDNRLVALPRDPLWFFTYWEVSAGRMADLRRQYGETDFGAARWVLKVYIVSANDGGGHEAAMFDVSLQSRQWYVKVAQSGEWYIAKLGFILPDGRFIEVLVSNRIRLPKGRVSEQTDSRWMAVGPGESDVEKWNRLMDASGSRNLGKGSAELARVMAQRWEFLKSVSSGSWSSAASPNSGAFPLAFYLPEEEKKP